MLWRLCANCHLHGYPPAWGNTRHFYTRNWACRSVASNIIPSNRAILHAPIFHLASEELGDFSPKVYKNLCASNLCFATILCRKYLCHMARRPDLTGIAMGKGIPLDLLISHLLFHSTAVAVARVTAANRPLHFSLTDSQSDNFFEHPWLLQVVTTPPITKLSQTA